jgi:hypothetical protein
MVKRKKVKDPSKVKKEGVTKEIKEQEGAVGDKDRRKRRVKRPKNWMKEGELDEDGNPKRKKTPPKFKKGVSDKIRLMQMRFANEQAEAANADGKGPKPATATIDNKPIEEEVEVEEVDDENKDLKKAMAEEPDFEYNEEDSGESEYTYETESGEIEGDDNESKND